MKVLVAAGQKGGVGKTTIALHLAVAAQEAGEIVCAIDMDPQQNLEGWGTRRLEETARTEPLVVTEKPAKLAHGLAGLKTQGFTLAIIDTAGMDHAATGMAMRHGDLCLIPVKSSIFDVESIMKTADRVLQLKRRFRFFLNEAHTPPNNVRNQETIEALTTLYEGHAVWLTTMIARRMDYVDSLKTGEGVTEFNKKGAAAKEVRTLWQELKTLMEEGDNVS